MQNGNGKLKVDQKFDEIRMLLQHIENYNAITDKPKEIERLKYYQAIIQEDLTFVIESKIREIE